MRQKIMDEGHEWTREQALEHARSCFEEAALLLSSTASDKVVAEALNECEDGVSLLRRFLQPTTLMERLRGSSGNPEPEEETP